MSSEQTVPTTTAPVAGQQDRPAWGAGEVRKVGAALGRYRVLAWITGTMLLVLVVEMVLKYVVQVGPEVMRWIEWVPFAHGWIYVVYLVTVLDLWSKVRWGFGRLTGLVLAGVVPVLSFVVERRVHREVSVLLEGAALEPST